MLPVRSGDSHWRELSGISEGIEKKHARNLCLMHIKRLVQEVERLSFWLLGVGDAVTHFGLIL